MLDIPTLTLIKENIGTLEEDGQKNNKNRIKIILKIFISILIIFTCLINRYW